MIHERLLSLVQDRVNVLSNFFTDVLVYTPRGIDSNGWGERVKAHPLRGTMEVRDFSSGLTLEVPGRELHSPQNFH